jgi:FixJ family two-component response regulator
LITGWEIQLVSSELKERGVDLIVSKPFNVKQILKLVQEAIELKNNFGTRGMMGSNSA